MDTYKTITYRTYVNMRFNPLNFQGIRKRYKSFLRKKRFLKEHTGVRYPVCSRL